MLYQDSLAGAEPFRGSKPTTLPESGPSPVAAAFAAMGSSRRVGRNTEVYGEGEPIESVYKVVTGAVRSYRLLSDGRRQIGDFHIAGDIFGLEGGDERQFTAEAIVDTTILVVKRKALASLAVENAALNREIWSQTAGELRRAQDHLMMLGRKRAQERVAAFLLDLAGRNRSDVIELPMSRQDIADYLGLTIETVSRTLTRLEEDESIAMPVARRIVLCDRGALGRLDS